MNDKVELILDVHEAGSWHEEDIEVRLIIEHFLTLLEAGKADGRTATTAALRMNKVRSKRSNLHVHHIPREVARWFGARLFRRIKVTFEDVGPLDLAEVERREKDEAGYGRGPRAKKGRAVDREPEPDEDDE